MSTEQNKNEQWEIWEVFLQEKSGEPHSHAGSVRAADKEMALQNARDVYVRRDTINNIWIVKTKDITATNIEDKTSFFDSTDDKVYRHPQFYKLPDGIKDAFKKR